MLHLHLDTAALGIPGIGADDPLVFEASLRRLLWLRNQAPEIFTAIMRSENAYIELDATGHYPTQTSITEWLALSGVDTKYTPKDVWNVFVDFIAKTKSIGAHCNVEVGKCSTFSAKPNVDKKTVGTDLLHLTQNAFASVSMSNHPSVPGVRLLLACVGLPSGEYQLEFSCEELPASLDGHYTKGVTYAGSAICIDESNPIQHLSAEKVWRTSSCAENLHLAIYLKARELQIAAGEDTKLSSFAIGSEFINSLRANQSLEDGRYASLVLECCARALAGMPKYTINDFRTRGEDKGRRTHIFKGHQALRLMYWQTKTGVEFSNIGPKNELVIEAGDPKRCYSTNYDRFLTANN